MVVEAGDLSWEMEIKENNCSNCKRPTWHLPDDCFELDKNKDNRPARWKSVLWRWGTGGIACNVNETITDNNYSLDEPNPRCIPPLYENLQENVPLTSRHKIARKWRRKLANKSARKMAMKDTAIVDSGASKWYLVPYDLVSNVNAHAPKVRVGMVTVQTQESESSCELPLDGMPPGLVGHIMPSFW